MDKKSDITLICRQCGKEFLFSRAEQEFYEEKGFNQPRRCKACRATSVPVNNVPVCSGCGSKLEQQAPVYCAACQAKVLQKVLDEAETKLNAVEAEKAKSIDEAETKLKAAEIEKTQLVDEVTARLSEAESDNARLVSLLKEKEQLAADLQKQLNEVGTELEKSLKYRASFDSLEPALHSLREGINAIINVQNDLSRNVLKIVEHSEQNGKNGPFSRFRHIFRAQ